MSDFFIRAACAHDQAAIVGMVRAAGINPLAIRWPNFLVAQAGNELIGIGQVKMHSDGSRELASIAVRPTRQGDGIATALILELLRRESGPIYLYCRESLGPFYARFGFVPVRAETLPPVLRRTVRIFERIAAVARLLAGVQAHLLVMRRPPQGDASSRSDEAKAPAQQNRPPERLA